MHQPATLILGAGSSADYGYPVGRGLRRKILEIPPDDLNRMQRSGMVWDTAQFQQAFRESRLRSIDAFLARQSRFTEIGKMAIARVLLGCEERSGANVEELEDDWQGYLINRLLVEDWEGFDPSWLTIITFNYDRSLEHALCSSVQATYGKTRQEALERLAKLRILHVYGSVGDPSHRCEQLPYGAARNSKDELRDMCRIACRNLRVIPEGRDDDPSLTPIREALSSATRICFLGFSFDAANVRRLGAPDVFVHASRNVKAMAATTKGMTAREARSAFASLHSGKNVVDSTMPDTFIDVGCEQLLRQTLFLG